MMRFHHPRHASLSTSFVLGSSLAQMKHLPLHPLYITVTIPGAQSSSPFHHHQYPCPSLSGGVCVHSHEAAEQGAGDNRRWTFLLVFISRWLLDIAGRRCLSLVCWAALVAASSELPHRLVLPSSIQPCWRGAYMRRLYSSDLSHPQPGHIAFRSILGRISILAGAAHLFSRHATPPNKSPDLTAPRPSVLVCLS